VVYDHVIPGAPLWMGAIILGVAGLLMMFVKNKTAVNTTVSTFSAAD